MGTSQYILKHEDSNVLLFDINIDYYNVIRLEIIDEKWFPVNKITDTSTQIALLNGWLSDRCIPGSREGADRLKNKYNLKDIKELMLAMHGLSLSDHYWIDRKPYNTKWKDINLYENSYNESIGRALIDKRFKLVKSLISYGDKNPDVTTIGSLKKYWHYNKKDGISYLYKGGSKIDFQEPFNEYFAHLLLKELGFPHTPYSIEKEGDEYFSVCPCISDINNEMVSAVDILRRYNISKDYDGFVSIGKKKGCIGFEHEVNRMIILDYFIDNIDRHWYNFGVLLDSKTGSWKGLIPLFDNGFSLWNKDFVISSSVSESMSFADSNEDCMKRVFLPNYVKNIPDMPAIFDEAFNKYENKTRKENLRNGIIEKTNILKKYLNNSLKTSHQSEIFLKDKKSESR